MGFVYVIQMGDFDIYKVGITSSNPTARLAQLQTGNPYKLEIVSLYQLESYAKLERMLHDALAQYRMEGEWFATDITTIRHVIAGLTKVQQAKSKVAELVRRNKLQRFIPKEVYT